VFILGIARPRVTDSAGYFLHVRLDATSYLIQIRLSGYVVMTWEVTAGNDTSVIHQFPLLPLDARPPSGAPGNGVIRGRVTDGATKAPIAEAEVSVVGRLLSARTDGAGRFRHAGLGAHGHMVQVRKIGYEPVLIELTAAAESAGVHEVELYRSDAVLLDTVVVRDSMAPPTSYWHPDFERRRTEGRGQFVTRQQIEQRNAATLGDLLRTLNGLRTNCRPGGCTVWMTRSNCRPSYFADGFPVEASAVERMPVNDVFGVEVYDLFEVPAELQQSRLRCGVIAVWTRRGPPPRR
jgi:hypothetical protein